MGRRIDERRLSILHCRSRLDERSAVRVLVFMGHADSSTCCLDFILLLSLAAEGLNDRRDIYFKHDEHVSTPDIGTARDTKPFYAIYNLNKQLYAFKVYVFRTIMFARVLSARWKISTGVSAPVE